MIRSLLLLLLFFLLFIVYSEAIKMTALPHAIHFILNRLNDASSLEVLRHIGFERDDSVSKGHRSLLIQRSTNSPVVVFNNDKKSTFQSKIAADKGNLKMITSVCRRFPQFESIAVHIIESGVARAEHFVNAFFRQNEILPSVERVLAQHGDTCIRKVILGRYHFPTYFNNLLDAVSFGDYSRMTKLHGNVPYHTYILVELESGARLRLEKNPDVQILDYIPDTNKAASFLKVNHVPQGITLRRLIENTRNRMQTRFNHYDLTRENCQHFMVDVLNANGLMDHGQMYQHFVLQPSLRSYMNSYEKFVVDSASAVVSNGANFVDLF